MVYVAEVSGLSLSNGSIAIALIVIPAVIVISFVFPSASTLGSVPSVEYQMVVPSREEMVTTVLRATAPASTLKVGAAGALTAYVAVATLLSSLPFMAIAFISTKSVIATGAVYLVLLDVGVVPSTV